METWPANGFEPDVDTENYRLRNDPPSCGHCGGPARPNILMFADWGWCEWRAAMQTVRMEEWLQTVQRPVVIELGAGSTIPSVRLFSDRMIHQFDSTHPHQSGRIDGFLETPHRYRKRGTGGIANDLRCLTEIRRADECLERDSTRQVMSDQLHQRPGSTPKEDVVASAYSMPPVRTRNSNPNAAN